MSLQKVSVRIPETVLETFHEVASDRFPTQSKFYSTAVTWFLNNFDTLSGSYQPTIHQPTVNILLMREIIIQIGTILSVDLTNTHIHDQTLFDQLKKRLSSVDTSYYIPSSSTFSEMISVSLEPTTVSLIDSYVNSDDYSFDNRSSFIILAISEYIRNLK